MNDEWMFLLRCFDKASRQSKNKKECCEIEPLFEEISKHSTWVFEEGMNNLLHTMLINSSAVMKTVD